MFNFREKKKEKRIQEVTEIFSELKTVEIDIKEINAFVEAVVSGDIKTIINLRGEKLVNDYDPKEGYEKDVPRIMDIGRFIAGSLKKYQEDQQLHLTYNLDETLVLQVMAVILRAKEEYRDSLVKKLEKLGLKLA